MTTMKNSTKRPAKKKAAKGKAAEVQAISYHLAKLLHLMREVEWLPACVYNDFAEAMNNITNMVNDDDLVHSEAHVRLYVEALAKKGGTK